MCNIQYNNSVAVTKSLVNHIVNQRDLLELDEESIKEAKKKIKADKEKRNAQNLEDLRQVISNDQKKLLEVTSEVGASSWLNAIPLKSWKNNLSGMHYICRMDSCCHNYSRSTCAGR